MAVRITAIVSMPFAENTFVIHRPDRTDCVVVDPGLEPDRIDAYLAEHGLTPAAILNTHGHADHIAGNEAMKAAYPDAPLLIGRLDAPLLADPIRNVSRNFGFDITSPPADQLLDDGDTVTFAGLTFDVRHIPGHSPGHVVFLVRGEGMVIGGDVLFRGGVGRTDFKGGSMKTLLAGIRDKLLNLPPETVVHPGHGPATKVGDEARDNPFLSGQFDDEP